ncbi:proteasome subunit beta type-11-like [Trichomycterus rosablanca]|uniref:proteasome subunit beta type-11-like n=1 Tax=Trichomycterus rosablanca TaxID=2290929 RepID=UPI002F3591C0
MVRLEPEPPVSPDYAEASSGFSLVPYRLSHGTTTLGFVFQGGVIAAADTRASCAGLIACPSAQKVMPIHSHLVTTTSGSGADCMLWERILAREIRLYELRHSRRISVSGAAKLLSLMLHPFKGTEVCVALTLCGWDVKKSVTEAEIKQNCGTKKDVVNLAGEPGNGSARLVPISELNTLKARPFIKTQQSDKSCGEYSRNSDQNLDGSEVAASNPFGPKVYYVCSDGLLLRGNLISVGSGSPYAYSVLDDGLRWRMSVDEAVALAREAVFRATHRDAYSGNNVDLFHITANGWSRRSREDLKEEYYHQKEKKKKMMQQRVEEKQN